MHERHVLHRKMRVRMHRAILPRCLRRLHSAHFQLRRQSMAVLSEGRRLSLVGESSDRELYYWQCGQIYDTREACCDSSFPYLNSNSNNCNPILETGPPTKHPTISIPEDDEYEIIPLRFDIQGFTSLGLTLCFFSLLQTPISISCRTSPDINYFNDENVELNFCSLENGRFSNCVYNTDTPGPAPSTINNNRPTVSSPTTIYAPTYGTSPTNSSVNVQYGGSNGDDDGSGGLAGWAIFLIVSLELVILCCVGYCTFLFVSRTDVMMMVILRRKFIKTFTSAMTRV
mmetsp:Transcript_17130/g.31061  ORF Transcript_17130/g.31061 Transcript_17130/m.31061 type:complete len:286 (+) Transcript_17130:977-1834(+)